MESRADIGVVGLGVMGRNLAANIQDKGFGVVGFDADATQRGRAAADGLVAAASMEVLVVGLRGPRAVLLLVPAGPAVDAAIATLRPLLAAGDIIVDGGNSHYPDTIRRGRELAAAGLGFVGLGVSGGEEGARHGPALMAGGDAAAWGRLEPLLTAIAARFDGQPCCGHVGADGAGHFVKMAHNGIEYGQMQLIAEACLLLRHAAGLDWPAAGTAVAGWNAGEDASYLLAITGDILATRDGQSGRPLLELTADRTGHKGTGVWTVEAALGLGVPVPTMAAAVWARALSATRDQGAVDGAYAAPAAPLAAGDIGVALAAASLVAYAEGLDLIAAGAAHHGWRTDRAAVAELWRAGCIIRSATLDRIAAALRAEPGNQSFLDRRWTRGQLADALPAWRRVLAAGADIGVPLPAFAAAFHHAAGRAAPEVGARVVAAQRDRFGAHGFARIDRGGTHHAAWDGK
ncbi:6-phosphogluconate dehydrogenase [Stella humosa]|uniref:6-phosphogluconate dehydrogenase, decarboxylating n=1 Tax=Stella humosa TaxID=94 RepID=A0A3N1MDY7_9PROT|nr:NADP-dependent phosphogluconate dehydrogenase [Stella humosa]ROQ00960.1 6-phosphogluconate dehydrogenase [Stella humosa]BBK31327.1 6-phosphogluconate dehydrogenase, decarboxylating [Stella humosa]